MVENSAIEWCDHTFNPWMGCTKEFIAATLRQFGQVRRGDIVREFGVTVAIASRDIAEFLAADPPHVTYDVSGKAYVLVEPAEGEAA
jgi:hypothetical protein